MAKYPPIPFKIKTPSAFTWDHPLKRLIRLPNGKFKTPGFSVTKYKMNGNNYYVDVENGSDDNDGLTLETAFKTINKAFSGYGVFNDVSSVASAVISGLNEYPVDNSYAWKVVTPGNAVDEGIKRTTNLTTVAGRQYTAEATIYAPLGSKIKMVMGGNATTTITEQPQTLTYTYTATGTSHGVAIRTGTEAQAITFFVKDWTVKDNVDNVNLLTPYMTNPTPIVINVAEGVYNKTEGFNNTAIGCAAVIQGIGGDVIISAEDSLTWTLTSGQTNTYEAAETTQVYRVFDSKTIDSNGDYTEYTKKTSIAEVEATPGSWYWASNKLYVHTTDHREPDTDIHGYLAIKQIESANNLYLENIEVHGGGSSSTTSYGPVCHSSTNLIYEVYMKNCKVKYSVADNKGIFCSKSHGFMENVEAACNDSDGYNYHNTTQVLELNCVGRDNGVVGDASDNGSSAHDGCTIMRVNGRYMRNHGPNVIDINEGTLSWNLGVVAYESKASLATNNSDFHNQQCLMWLDNCRSYGSTYGMGCDGASPLGTTRIRQCKEFVQRVLGGNVESY
jgi:hypothetical protein